MNKENANKVALYKGKTGFDLYNLWYNEQGSRVFGRNQQDFSFDECFEIVHNHITSRDSFRKWCNKHQNGLITYVPGSQGAKALKITFILNNYVKSLMGLPFYKYGGFEYWVNHKSPVIREIGEFSLAPKYDRYILIRSLMVESMIPLFSELPFRDLLINSIVTVYHSETNMEVFVHNGYPNFGKSFYSESEFKHLGKPNSTAFGLGQWLGNRLLDYYYFVAERLTLLSDPRLIGPEILYHPSFQIAFMAFELRKGSYYYKRIARKLINWKNAGTEPTYLMMVGLILEYYQGIKPNDSQFAAVSKISDEKKTVDRLPAEFVSSFNISKLL